MSPLCARLEDEDPQGVAPPEWRIPIHDPVQPGEPVLLQAIQELILVRLHVLATQEEGQDQSFEVIVWFLDSEHQLVCHEGREVDLNGADPAAWIQLLQEAWRDKINPELPLHAYLVSPSNNHFGQEEETSCHPSTRHS